MKNKLMPLICCCMILFGLAPALAAQTPGTQYRLTALQFSEETAVQLTFGGDFSPADARLVRQDTDDDRVLFQLKGQDGTPFLAIGPLFPNTGTYLNSITLLRIPDETPDRVYNYYLDTWNALPEESGFDAPRAKEFLSKGSEMLTALGLTDAVPVSFSALGRMEGTTKSYRVLFRQTLEGLPLYWSHSALDGDDYTPVGDGLYAEVIFSDEEGLLTLRGTWSAFSPLHSAARMLNAADAEQVFASYGFTGEPEACYYLTARSGEATAIRAWRCAQAYINAETGELLEK